MTSRAVRVTVMMMRPPVALAIFLFAAIGLAQAGHGDAIHPLFTVIPVILAGWFVHSTVLNDLGDEAIDRVNLGTARGRPLVSGEATRAELRALGAIGAGVALVTAFAVNGRVGAVVAAGLALSAAYSVRPVRLCDRGAAASLLLPLGYVAVPYLVGLLSAQPRVRPDDLVLLAGLYVTFIGRILLKDFRDVRGDAMFGKRTFLLRHGRALTCRTSAACWIAGSATLLFLLPWRSAVTFAVAATLACALHGLRRLAAAGGFVEEQVIVGAIAQCGRGMGVALLAHLTMVDKGWAVPAQTLVLLTVTLLYSGLYASTLGQRGRLTAALVRPY